MPEFKAPTSRKQNIKTHKRPGSPSRLSKPRRTGDAAISVSQGRQNKPRQALNRRRKQNMAIYYMLILFVSATVFAIMSATVLFSLEHIYTEGESVYSEEQIIEASGAEPGTNLIRFNAQQCRQRIIDSLVYIDEVSIKKKLPNKLEINVTTAVEMANIEHSGTYYIVSGNGRILGRALPHNMTNIIIFGYEADEPEVGGFIRSVNERKSGLIFTVIETAQAVGLTGIKDINMQDALDIRLNYMDFIELHIGPATDLELKLSSAVKLLSEELDEPGTLRLIDPHEAVFTPR